MLRQVGDLRNKAGLKSDSFHGRADFAFLDSPGVQTATPRFAIQGNRSSPSPWQSGRILNFSAYSSIAVETNAIQWGF